MFSKGEKVTVFTSGIGQRHERDGEVIAIIQFGEYPVVVAHESFGTRQIEPIYQAFNHDGETPGKHVGIKKKVNQVQMNISDGRYDYPEWASVEDAEEERVTNSENFTFIGYFQGEHDEGTDMVTNVVFTKL